MKKFISDFISGLIFPAIVLPFAMLGMLCSENMSLIIDYPIFMLPWVWGLWNAIFSISKKIIPFSNEKNAITVHGAILGLLLSFLIVYYYEITKIAKIFTSNTSSETIKIIEISTIIFITFFYASLWRWIVNPLNTIFSKKHQKYNDENSL